MSSSRRSAASSRWTSSNQGEVAIGDLILKLQALLPERNSGHPRRVAAAAVVEEVCNYIRNLHQQVDHLSERLSELLASMDNTNTVDPDLLLQL